MSTEVYIPPPSPLEFFPGPLPWEQWDRKAEKVLEIGPGKGEFLLHLAQSFPHTRHIGVELKKGRFEKICKKAQACRLDNLHLVRGDARECLPRLFPETSLDRVYILFPDPWPKARHAKHRLLKQLLINNLHFIIKEKGEVYSATDAGFYSEEIVAAFTAAGGFRAEPVASLFPTYFEQKWKALGRKIDYWRFSKI
jgi:tRNA (guanine-N7-)-methyltransferase